MKSPPTTSTPPRDSLPVAVMARNIYSQLQSAGYSQTAVVNLASTILGLVRKEWQQRTI